MPRVWTVLTALCIPANLALALLNAAVSHNYAVAAGGAAAAAYCAASLGYWLGRFRRPTYLVVKPIPRAVRVGERIIIDGVGYLAARKAPAGASTVWVVKR